MKSLTISDQYVVTILEEIKIKKAWNHMQLSLYEMNLQVASEYQREPHSQHINPVTTDCTMSREQLHTADVQEEHENMVHKMPHQITLQTWRDVFSHFSKCHVA